MISVYLAASAPPLQESGGVTWWVILLWVIAIVLAIIFWQWWKYIEEEAEEANVQQRELELAGTIKSEYVQDMQAAVRLPTAERVEEPTAEEEAEETAEETALPDTAEATEVEEETAVAAAPPEPDDLTKIEGVGPKIAGLLNDAGILTFAQLSQTENDQLEQILADAGSRYQLADPATWPQQAALAAEGKWEALETLQDELKGGREA